MNTIELFKDYLVNISGTSKVTAKNYVSDVNKFIKWYELKYQKPFSHENFGRSVIDEFIKCRGALITPEDETFSSQIQPDLTQQPSVRSFERYLSTLRRYAAFLVESHLIPSNPFDNFSLSGITPLQKKDPWSLKLFKDFLYVGGASKITSKNYIVDLNAFTSWLEYKGYIKELDSNYIESINPEIIEAYKAVLSNELDLSASTINRKMSSIRKYLAFAVKNGLINPAVITPPAAAIELAGENESTYELATQPDNDAPAEAEGENHLNMSDIETLPKVYSPFPPARLLQKLTEPYILFEDMAARKIAMLLSGGKLSLKRPNFKQPNWYKKYHTISFVHYLHLAILIIYASFIGILVYNGLFIDASKNQSLAASPPKVLSFQGRLTDNNNNPITSTTNVRFQIYNNLLSTGSAALLWQEVDQVTPDSNGFFSILLGNTGTVCSSPTTVATSSCSIPISLFGANTNLFLGITVENTAELTPRQQLATSPYASNSQMLEGMLPITDSAATQANVILALDSSGVLTIGGSAAPTFQATGGKFTLTGKSLHLKTNEGSAENIILEPDGIGKIDLKSPLFNSGTNGNIAPGGVEIQDKTAILATESAVAAFIVNNDTTGGDIFAASSSGITRFIVQNTGDLAVYAGTTIDTIGTGTISLGSINATNISIGRFGQNITLPGYTDQNGVLFGSYGTGDLDQATTSTAGLCLVSGLNDPSWGSCSTSTTSPFQQTNGTISANNSTVDFFIGGQSTQSAKFSVTNMNSGTPTASIAGNFIVMPNTALLAGGNVGIGVANPTHTLQLGNDDAAKELTTTWTVTSDVRTKKDISEFTAGLDIIDQINPVNFTYNGLGGTTAGTQGIGVIAQDVKNFAPYMIGEFDAKLHPNDTNTTKLLDFNPHALFFITINAIKELNSKLTKLADNVTTKSVVAGNIATNSISVATDSITIAGQSLSDYVKDVVAQNDTGQSVSCQLLNVSCQIISPLASIDELHAGIISPLPGADEVMVKGNVAISGSASVSGKLTADSLATTADATIGGQLTANGIESNSLTVNDATVSGTLYANNIKADSIENLDSRILSAYHQQLANIAASGSSNLAFGQLSNAEGGQMLDIETISSDFATFRQGLIALGPASFTQASFSDSLSVGTTMQISSNSINTIGTDLALQPLKQGAIDFLAGAVRIEVDGTLKVAGDALFARDVTIKGKLKTGRIEPGDNGLVIEKGLDVQGSASVSGGLTINKLNLFDAQPAYALSDTEVVATSSAGTESVRPYRTELTIYDSNVTDKSLIYISPIGSSNQTLSLLRQIPGVSFTVGIPQPVISATKFNWIIVN